MWGVTALGKYYGVESGKPYEITISRRKTGIVLGLLFCFTIILQLVIGCSSVEEETQPNSGRNWNSINYTENRIRGYGLDGTDLIDVGGIQDPESALIVADVYLKGSGFSKWIPKLVDYDTFDRIWYVMLCTGTTTLGPGLTVGIRQDTGEVIGTWLDPD